jgi:hypothetical protein
MTAPALDWLSLASRFQRWAERPNGTPVQEEGLSQAQACRLSDYRRTPPTE